MTELVKLTPEQIRAIEESVSRGVRVEVIPVREGVKLMRQRREEIRVQKV